ncbi:MAG TPA: hypothetical protein DIT05_10955 [Morganella sp. (in: Bacteria)]|nr:hypothetical protein [Morganella sp. (in: enterobacteria)]
MTHRYEDTTPFERDIMTSMGYHWKGEGWQKATDNGDTMVVTGWVGDIPTEPGQYTHTWDRDLADINTSPNPVWDDADDGWMHPVDEDIRKQRRDDSAKKLDYLTKLEAEIRKDIIEVTSNIDKTKEQNENTNDVLENATLTLIIKKLQLQKERIINLLNEARKRTSDTERKRLSDESWFYNSELNRRMQDKTQGEIKKEWEKGKAITKEIDFQAQTIKIAENDVKKAEDEFSQVKTAVKFTADFYKEIFKVHGEKAEQLAKALAAQAKGKKIRNADDAAKAWEKHKANPDKKINSQDRAAITKWLESVDVKAAAENFKWFSKGMGYTSQFIDLANWSTSLYNAIQTGDWRPFFVKTETIATGMAATVVVAFAFSMLIGNPVGLVMYGLIMGGIGFIIDDAFVEKANQFWGI